MFQMLPEAWLKLTPFPQNQMLVCPQPTIRDLKKAQTIGPIFFIIHPQQFVNTRPPPP